MRFGINCRENHDTSVITVMAAKLVHVEIQKYYHREIQRKCSDVQSGLYIHRFLQNMLPVITVDTYQALSKPSSCQIVSHIKAPTPV